MDAEQKAKAIVFLNEDLKRLADERVDAIEKVARAIQRVEKVEDEVTRIEGMMAAVRGTIARSMEANSDDQA